MTSIRNAVKDANKRQFAKQFKVEICAVDKVHWYKEPGSRDLNVVTVVIRDRRLLSKSSGSVAADGTGGEKRHIRKRVNTIPCAISNCGGTVYLPRRGDLVRVLFYQNKLGVILGPVRNYSEKPPVMQSPYDRIDKWGQWQRPEQDENLDFKPKTHPEIKKPICHKIHHGPPLGECGYGRDEISVHECSEGDCTPDCSICLNIDSVCDCGNTLTKIYSSQTMAAAAKKNRWHFHHKSGSHFLFEKEGCQNGHVLLENGIACATPCGTCGRDSDKKLGHHDFSPGYGTNDIHSKNNCSAEFPDESCGVRCSVVDPGDDRVDFAFEAIQFETGAYIRIMKNGEIKIYSPVKITLDSKNVEITGSLDVKQDELVEGTCSGPNNVQ